MVNISEAHLGSITDTITPSYAHKKDYIGEAEGEVHVYTGTIVV